MVWPKGRRPYKTLVWAQSWQKLGGKYWFWPSVCSKTIPVSIKRLAWPLKKKISTGLFPYVGLSFCSNTDTNSSPACADLRYSLYLARAKRVRHLPTSSRAGSDDMTKVTSSVLYKETWSEADGQFFSSNLCMLWWEVRLPKWDNQERWGRRCHDARLGIFGLSRTRHRLHSLHGSRLTSLLLLLPFVSRVGLT